MAKTTENGSMAKWPDGFPAKAAFPEGWTEYSIDRKTELLDRKLRKLIHGNDMYEIKRGKVCSNDGEDQWGFFIAVRPGHHFTRKGTCLGRMDPIPDREIDWSVIPEDLAGMMKDNVFLGRLPASHSLNMLNPDIGGKTFEEAADKMFRYLDLLACGYGVREVQWYMEIDHPELFPGKKK